MKKLLIVLAVGMITADGMAQSGKKTVPPPPPPPQQIKEIPAPPPPPPPPPENVQFTPPGIKKNPPPPPRPPKADRVMFTPPMVVNEKGYAITVMYQPKAEPWVVLRKKGLTQKIRMSVWNAKPEYFENKYGQLPPPPPPPPAPPVKE